MTLALPRPIEASDAVWLEVRLGRLAPGQTVDVTTADGLELGVISPLNLRPGQDAGTYILPIPRAVVSQSGLTLRFSVTQAGASPRAAEAKEVSSAKLSLTNKP
jgi:hypothetical protein